MENLSEAMDSMDELYASLKKIEQYNFLYYLTGRMVVTVLMFLAVAFFAYILILMNNFQSINPYLGSIRLSGSANFGTYLHVFFLLLVAGAIVVFITNLRLNRRALRTGQWESETFDRSKGKDELLGAITRIDWARTRRELKVSKLSFILYNVAKVGIYSFLLFFILDFLDFFVFSSTADLVMRELHLSYGMFFELVYVVISILAVLISVGILRKSLRNSVVELRELDAILSELRWFLNEFEKSGL